MRRPTTVTVSRIDPSTGQSVSASRTVIVDPTTTGTDGVTTDADGRLVTLTPSDAIIREKGCVR